MGNSNFDFYAAVRETCHTIALRCGIQIKENLQALWPERCCQTRHSFRERPLLTDHWFHGGTDARQLAGCRFVLPKARLHTATFSVGNFPLITGGPVVMKTALLEAGGVRMPSLLPLLYPHTFLPFHVSKQQFRHRRHVPDIYVCCVHTSFLPARRNRAVVLLPSRLLLRYFGKGAHAARNTFTVMEPRPRARGITYPCCIAWQLCHACRRNIRVHLQTTTSSGLASNKPLPNFAHALLVLLTPP